MSDRPMHLDRLRELLNALTDGGLDQPTDRAELAALLKADEAARRYYAEHMTLHAMLRHRRKLTASREAMTNAARADATRGRRRIGGWLRAAAAAAAIALAVAAAWRFAPAVERADHAKAPTTATPLAVLTSGHDVQWASEPTEVGQTVGRTPLAIESGSLSLTFLDGTALRLIGPARMAASGQASMQLTQGSVMATVNSAASHFTVHAPGFDVVDMGTQFGVTVDAGGGDVHVFRGRVQLRVAGRTPILLTAGQARRIDTSGSVRVIEVQRRRFGLRDLPDGVLRAVAGLWSFDAGDGGDASGRGHDATALSHVTFGPGVDGGRAVRLSGEANSYVELPVDVRPTSMPRMTWGCWIRPDRVTNREEILSADMMGYQRTLTIDTRRGERDAGGEPRVGAFGGANVGVAPSGQAVSLRDRWTFVAAVYDQAARRVDVYVEDPSMNDGRGGLVHSSARTNISGGATSVRLGAHHTAGEPFAGSIDDVFIIADALTAEQLETIRSEGPSTLRSTPSP